MESEEQEAGEGELAPPAPGLRDEAVQPFDAEAAHPGRSASGDPGDKVKGAAHADHDRHTQPRAVAGELGVFVDGEVGCLVRLWWPQPTLP